MEKQVRSIYTNEKFLEFQMEITKKTYCEVIDVDVVGDSPVLTYHIQEEKWIPKPKDEENACLESTDLESTPENACLQNTVLESIPDSPSEDEKEKIMIRVIYKVSFQKDGCKFECSCHNFEFRGIVCRHAIMVLHRNDIFVLPEKYLLQRWRKDVKRIHTNMQYSSDAWKLTPKQKRHNELCNSFAVLADAASSSDVKFADIKKWIQAQLEVSNFNEDSTCKLNAIVETTNSPPIESKKIRNPPAAPKKGHPKENTPKAKVYTKNPRKGKENAEVNIQIPTQQSVVHTVALSQVNQLATNLTYNQYLQALQLSPNHLHGPGFAINNTSAYGVIQQQQTDSRYTNVTPFFGYAGPRYGVQPHSLGGGLYGRKS
ncbi:hypothetical protein MKX03_006625 [Papaver bracteatum]|nr:hypothetical protein MKX03_006625 [Papaver bracteatum]